MREFEHAQDEALRLGGEVIIDLLAAQREEQLAPSVTQAAMAALAAGIAQLTAGRGLSLDGHKALETVARLYRIEYDYGDGIKYPPSRGQLSAAAA